MQPPDLVHLQEFLSATPSARVPILPVEYAQLPADLQQKFIPANGFLARAFTNSIFPIIPYGSASERITVGTHTMAAFLYDHACMSSSPIAISFCVTLYAAVDGEYSRRDAAADPGLYGRRPVADRHASRAARHRCAVQEFGGLKGVRRSGWGWSGLVWSGWEWTGAAIWAEVTEVNTGSKRMRRGRLSATREIKCAHAHPPCWVQGTTQRPR